MGGIARGACRRVGGPRGVGKSPERNRGPFAPHVRCDLRGRRRSRWRSHLVSHRPPPSLGMRCWRMLRHQMAPPTRSVAAPASRSERERRLDPGFSRDVPTPRGPPKAGRPREQSLPCCIRPCASGPIDHQGNRAVAQVDNDDLPVGNQKAKLLQFRRSIQHDLRKIVELHVIGNVRAEG